MVDKSPEQLAREHSEWFCDVFSELMKKVFYEAFIHGYKHGKGESGRED